MHSLGELNEIFIGILSQSPILVSHLCERDLRCINDDLIEEFTHRYGMLSVSVHHIWYVLYLRNKCGGGVVRVVSVWWSYCQ